jgi:hypothetical protein
MIHVINAYSEEIKMEDYINNRPQEQKEIKTGLQKTTNLYVYIIPKLW